MNMFNKEGNNKFAILSGSDSDLSLLDFSHIGMRFVKANSEEFDIILNTNSHNQDWYQKTKKFTIDKVNEDLNDEVASNSLYVLMPIDLSINAEEENLYNCYRILLLIFPSVLTYYSEWYFQVFDDKYINATSYTSNKFYKKTDYENYLTFSHINIPYINHFIKLYFERYKNIKYLKPAMESYELSFFSNISTMSYISLCICLETIVSGSNEIIYRLKRNISVICSENEEHGNRIFKNVDNIYKLRSKIVHEGLTNYDKMKEYKPYLQALVSKVFAELIIHNIDSVEELNNKLTSIGFGDKHKLSNEYTVLKMNYRVNKAIRETQLSSFKL